MIAVIDYGIDNEIYLTKLLERVETDFIVTSNESEILKSEKIILPHTQNTAKAVKQLHLLNLFTMLRVCSKPMLGISSGMHLMSAYIKDSNLACLGIFTGAVEKFKLDAAVNSGPKLRKITTINESRLLMNLKGDEKFYFDNLYYLPVDHDTTAVSGDGDIFTAVIERSNHFGIQFLPEMSGAAGITVLQNFIC